MVAKVILVTFWILVQHLTPLTMACYYKENRKRCQRTALVWFYSHLAERYQHVNVDSELSANTWLQCGAPQGSVLEPILFTIYIAQLGKIIYRHQIARQHFADDTS